jgi:Flp pilus assembly pilin Flp
MSRGTSRTRPVSGAAREPHNRSRAAHHRRGRSSVMKYAKQIVAKLIKDEQGGEVMEYALIAGLIVVAAIAVITSVGNKVLARWQSLNSSM